MGALKCVAHANPSRTGRYETVMSAKRGAENIIINIDWGGGVKQVKHVNGSPQSTMENRKLFFKAKIHDRSGRKVPRTGRLYVYEETLTLATRDRREFSCGCPGVSAFVSEEPAGVQAPGQET